MDLLVRSRTRVADALAAAVLIAACGTGRLGDGAAPVDLFTPGITTVEDATALLGLHTSEKGYPNGQRLLQRGSVAAPLQTLPRAASGSHLARTGACGGTAGSPIGRRTARGFSRAEARLLIF